MKTINMQIIRSWNPCYDPNKYLPENWTGTIIDILDNKEIPSHDRLWCALRTEIVSEKVMRIFAVWCARQVQHLIKDQRSIDCLDVMDAYCDHYWLIDDEGWRDGWTNERAAAWDAVRAVAGSAAGSAAVAAARAAARDAARAAAWDAAGSAAWAAAWAAARDAAWAAARAAAGSAAWAAAGSAQISKLKEMILMDVTP